MCGAYQYCRCTMFLQTYAVGTNVVRATFPNVVSTSASQIEYRVLLMLIALYGLVLPSSHRKRSQPFQSLATCIEQPSRYGPFLPAEGCKTSARQWPCRLPTNLEPLSVIIAINMLETRPTRSVLIAHSLADRDLILFDTVRQSKGQSIALTSPSFIRCMLSMISRP